MNEQSRAQYWDSIVDDFDAIYTGQGRSKLAAALDHWPRAATYQGRLGQ